MDKVVGNYDISSASTLNMTDAMELIITVLPPWDNVIEDALNVEMVKINDPPSTIYVCIPTGPGQRTGLLIYICMCTNRPRSIDRAYDLKNQSHKTGDNTSI